MAYPSKNSATPTFAGKNSSSFTLPNQLNESVTWVGDLYTWVAELRTWAQMTVPTWSYQTKN